MKKLILSFAVIVTAMLTVNTVMAQDSAPAASECTLKQYPRLYSTFRNGKTLPNGDKVTYVTMRIPISHAVYSESGDIYYVIHPTVGNECVDMMSTINDKDKDLQKLVALARTYPNELSKIAVTIQLKYVNGKTDDTWTIVGASYPSYL